MTNSNIQDSARIALLIQRRDDGAILTDHRPMSDEDMAALMAWPTNGQVHVAQALLTEAIRREARVVCLIQMTKGLTPEDLDAEEIDRTVRVLMSETLHRICSVLVGSVVEDLRKSSTES